MPCVPITRNAIYKLLETNGPMTAAQIAEELSFKRKRVDASIIEARAKYGTKFFRITGYERKVGVQGREAPLYGIGPRPDVPRPEMNTESDRKKIQQRYRDKYRYILRIRDQKRRHGSVNHFMMILGDAWQR